MPDGDVSLPTVDTENAAGLTSSGAELIGAISNNGGSDIIEEGFVYWNKLTPTSQYIIYTDPSADNTIKSMLTNLSADNEYCYYAFAENAAGIGKGYIKNFRTRTGDGKPNAITITPDHAKIKVGGDYQLMATVLPASASNRNVFWSSSDPEIATVDAAGKIKGIAEGEVIITAVTESGRLTAECIIEVEKETEVKEYDFSEWNMVTNTSYYAKDSLGYDWDTSNWGGNYQMGTAYLARWDGAVLEENDPYQTYNYTPEKYYKEKAADLHVQDVEWLPPREGALDNDEIKSALMEYGAVYSLMCIDWDCFDSSYTNYYCNYDNEQNGHAVTIVGWDDNYPKTSFKRTAPANGAFICKNSWGSGVGDGGYFYISYYDNKFGRTDWNAVVTGVETNSNYNKIYQYDPLGAITSTGYWETTYAANVFPESGKTLDHDEILRAVSFYTYHKNASYEVFIVTDFKDDRSLEQLRTPAASGVMKNGGYHTVALDAPVTLKAGTRFAVVIKLSVADDWAFIYIEEPIDGYSGNARANSNESFWSFDGSYWEDFTDGYPNANFCIKAFTDNGLSTAALYEGIDNANRDYESDVTISLEEAIEQGNINQAYVDYVNRVEGADSLSVAATSSAPQTTGTLPGIARVGTNNVSFTDGALFPAKYDLREMGLVSSVKNQGDWGTCWAHSMYASLESCDLRNQINSVDTGSIPRTMTLSHSELTLAKDSAVTLAKKISPASATDKNVTWMSSNTAVAEVDTNGTVHAVGGGLATISAVTVSGNIAAECSVYVEGEEIEASITLEAHSVNRAVGDRFMIAYHSVPMLDSSMVDWVSDNPAVAEVSENGIITAKANGAANISILNNNGNIQDTVLIKVGDGLNTEITGYDTSALSFTPDSATGGTLSGNISFTLDSRIPDEKPVSCMLAVYNADGSLAGVICDNRTLPAGTNHIAFEDVNITGVSDGYTIKLMVWSSIEHMKPLSAAAVLHNVAE